MSAVEDKMENVELFDDWFANQVKSILGALALIAPTNSIGSKGIFVRDSPDGFIISPPVDLPGGSPRLINQAIASFVRQTDSLGYFWVQEDDDQIRIIYSGLGGDCGFRCALSGGSIVSVDDLEPDPRFLGIGGVTSRYKMVN